jgi:uncharacterized MAPEG superfamily protein
MSATESTILWLVIWYAVLMVQLPAIRMIASRSTGSMKFDPNGADLEGYGQRLTRAVANCQENLPLAIGVLLLAMVTDNTAITNVTACWFLYARIGQSVVHLISTATPMVMLRFAFFLVQFGLLLCWTVQMLMK